MSDNWLKEQVAAASSTFNGWEKWQQDAYKAEVQRSKHRAATSTNERKPSKQDEGTKLSR